MIWLFFSLFTHINKPKTQTKTSLKFSFSIIIESLLKKKEVKEV
jgi:hypothetical protein